LRRVPKHLKLNGILLTFDLKKERPMPAKLYHVELTDQERLSLQQMLRRGKHSARKLTRARILLQAADGFSDDEIAEAVLTSVPTIERLRKRFVEVRLEALSEKPRPGKQPRLDEKAEARLIAEACSTPPDGRERWTLQLLADRVVQLQLADSCSADTVQRVLKKRPQAVAETAVVHSRSQQRVCRLHGRCARLVCRAL
jgi:transposase